MFIFFGAKQHLEFTLSVRPIWQLARYLGHLFSVSKTNNTTRERDEVANRSSVLITRGIRCINMHGPRINCGFG